MAKQFKITNQPWLDAWNQAQQSNKGKLPVIPADITPVFEPLTFAAANLIYFTEEYKVKSLPAFYGKITQNEIFNALGEVVVTSYAYKKAYEILMKKGLLSEADIALIKAINYPGHEHQYYFRPPLDEVLDFIISLSDESRKNLIIKQTYEEIDACYNVAKSSEPSEPLQENSSSICRVM